MKKLLVTSLFLLLFIKLHAQLSIGAFGTTYSVDFNVAGTSNCTAALTWTDNVTIPYCYTNKATYYYSDGCSNNGGVQISGVGGETAFGGRPSGSVAILKFGVRLKNNTGLAINQLSLKFEEEQWGDAKPDVINLPNNNAYFDYVISSSSITNLNGASSGINSSFDLHSLSTTTSACGTSTTAIPGGLSTTKNYTLNVTLNPGDEIMLRWTNNNQGCNDNSLLIDGLRITANLVPLPVTLLDFNTRLISDDAVMIEWTTASETNNDYFTVEKSTDGHNFVSMMNIPAKHNSFNMQKYILKDYDIDNKNKIYYYRLKQTDFNGLYTYSTTKYVIMVPYDEILFVYDYTGRFICKTKSAEIKNLKLAAGLYYASNEKYRLTINLSDL